MVGKDKVTNRFILRFFTILIVQRGNANHFRGFNSLDFAIESVFLQTVGFTLLEDEREDRSNNLRDCRKTQLVKFSRYRRTSWCNDSSCNAVDEESNEPLQRLFGELRLWGKIEKNPVTASVLRFKKGKIGGELSTIFRQTRYTSDKHNLTAFRFGGVNTYGYQSYAYDGRVVFGFLNRKLWLEIVIVLPFSTLIRDAKHLRCFDYWMNDSVSERKSSNQYGNHRIVGQNCDGTVGHKCEKFSSQFTRCLQSFDLHVRKRFGTPYPLGECLSNTSKVTQHRVHPTSERGKSSERIGPKETSNAFSCERINASLDAKEEEEYKDHEEAVTPDAA
ncbi:hypothetical protein CLF_101096 [Clonorchis sinensis]|uniref:Uncharacterized protein n=1 Tax=Clonorchis sinensis TaxID=79923 RepID=G7Y4Y4_CLOSI|nr:hypothetical protein CLF_101096 [Clonorchis sinensis]